MGSILIAPIAFFASKKPSSSKMIYLFCIIVLRYCFQGQIILPFVFGAFAYDCIANIDRDKSFFGRVLKSLMSNRIGKFTLIFLCVVGGWYLACVNKDLDGMYFIFSNPLLKRFVGNCNVISPLGFAIYLIGLDSCESMKSFLSSRPFSFLGRISAYIYAFHWPVILSAECGMFVLLNGVIGYGGNILIVSTVSCLITFLMALIWSIVALWIAKMRYVERWLEISKSA